MKQLAYRTLAQEAYAAYGTATGHRNWQGFPMPAWGDLGETIQRAWLEAVKRVCTLVDDTPPDAGTLADAYEKLNTRLEQGLQAERKDTPHAQ